MADHKGEKGGGEVIPFSAFPDLDPSDSPLYPSVFLLLFQRRFFVSGNHP